VHGMKWFACPLGLSLFLGLCGSLWADPLVVKTQITEVFTGWDAEQFGIITADPRVDPANCNPKADNHGYMSDIHQPGYHTFLAAALAAFAQRATVQVIVKETGCIVGHPILIGLNILRFP
jgi:hypothetical protein